MVVCVVLLVLGSPPVQKPVLDMQPSNGLLIRVQDVLSAPAWMLGAPAPVNARWAMAAMVAVLLAGVVLVLPRAGRRSRVTAVGAAVLIGALAGLADWIVMAKAGPSVFRPDSHQLLVYFIPDSATFGLVLGLLAGPFLAGSGAPGSGMLRAATRVTPWTGGWSSGMPGLADSSPSALGREPGDVTRYLCTAAYTVPGFARFVVEDVLADELGAIAPSPGVDLVPVAQHCLTARELRYHRDLRLSAVFAGMLLLAPAWLPVGCLLVSRLSSPPRPLWGSRGWATRRGPAAWPGLVTAVPMLAVLLALTVAGSLISLPGPVAWLLGTYLYGTPALLTLAVGLPVAHSIAAKAELDTAARLCQGLRRGRFAPDAAPGPMPSTPWVKERLRLLEEAQRGNVTVYSGWAPSVGFAATTASWQINIPLVPADARTAVTDFDAWEAIEHLRRHLQDLATHDGAEPPTPGEPSLADLQLEDRVFVHGATVAADERFMSGNRSTPSMRLDEEQVRHIAQHPRGTARHALGAHLPLWGGDVVASVFLQVAVTGQTLNLRCETHLLTPVRGGYHEIDVLPDRVTDVFRRAIRINALRRTGALLLTAPSTAWHHARFEARHAKRMRRELRAAEQDPAFDYGARTSVREFAFDPNYSNYFQAADGGRVTAALSRHSLAAIRRFLDAHGVDTSEFTQQQQTILNHGIIQQGGLSVVGNQAVGQGATAAQKNATQQSAA
ncbi:hypothetical protein GCM10010442_56150 [Kitasatospora kifunensis]